MEKKKPTALVLLADGVEEIEAITPIDLLRRAGLNVTLATIGADLNVTGRSGIRLAAERLLCDVRNVLFDVLVVPGGPGVANLRKSPDVSDIVTAHSRANRLVAAICAAPTLLLDAGLLKGRRYTAHFSVENELPDLISDKETLLDGNILTSRGAGTAIPFALEIIRVLCSADAAQDVAASICFLNRGSDG